ncbi:MAG: DNA primase [Anaeroplasmataceae bacterium]
MMVSTEQIQEVIDKSDMVEIVGEFVKLEKAGANYKGLCPFHNENTPSFVVSPQKKLATCFGCNKSLNPIGFIQEVKNVSFLEALDYVAKKTGIKLDISKRDNNKPDFSKYYKIMEKAQSFYTKNLFETKSGLVALDYLHKRGLDDETIKTFGIGLASSERDIIYRILNDLNISTLDMIDTGLVKTNDNKTYYDLFTKRIMFPLKDEEGNILGYSGRIYLTEDKNQPKYVNSPETIIFKKHLNLFNIDNAIPEIRKKHRVILHEGQMDVIASYKAGLKEALCSLGTALTKEQCQLIKKYTTDVILCYDGDSAGINASLKAIDLLKSQGLNVKLVLMEDAKDPDEYINKFGVSKYLDIFTNNILSEVEYRFLAIIKSRDLNDTSEFEKTKNEVFRLLSRERSQTLVERFLNKLSELSHISYSSLMLDYTTYSNIRPMTQYVEKNENPLNIKSYDAAIAVMSKYSLCELRLFKYATDSKDKAMYIDSKIDIGNFEPIHQSLWMQLIDSYYGFCEFFDEEKFLSLLSTNTMYFKAYTSDIMTLQNSLPIDYNDEDLSKCISVFNESGLVREINNLDKQINLEEDQAKKIELIQNKFNLLKIRNSNRK